MKNKSIIPAERIRESILVIRGLRVMLDRDLALLYGVETRVLNQAVKRNFERFPSDFMFELTRDEIRNISQFVICSSGFKHAPRSYAFTEQGVAMLSGILNSKRAIEVNVAIMRTFVQLRNILATHEDLARKLNELEKKYDEQFSIVFDAIRQIMKPPVSPKKKIGFHIDEKRAQYRVRKSK